MCAIFHKGNYIMEELLNKITEALGKLSDKHGEQAVTTLLETAQLMAMNDIIQTVISMAFGIVLIILLIEQTLLLNTLFQIMKKGLK